MSKMITVKACAKIILFGEHAVVYGKPGIAVPIKKLYTLATASSDSFSYTTDRELNQEEHMKISKLFKLLFEKLNLNNRNISIHIESNIPVAAGLGSSASLSISLIRSFSNFFDLNLNEEKINEIAYECEKLFHGNASGIDNTVINYEKPIFFQKGKIDFLKLKKPLHLLIASTGIISKTKETVFEVRENYTKNPEKYSLLFEKIGELSTEAKTSLEKGDIKRTGQLMTANHELLGELGVSSIQLDALVDKALSMGAYGAKLAGSGKGGDIIALVDEYKKEKIIAALKTLSREVISTVVA